MGNEVFFYLWRFVLRGCYWRVTSLSHIKLCIVSKCLDDMVSKIPSLTVLIRDKRFVCQCPPPLLDDMNDTVSDSLPILIQPNTVQDSVSQKMALTHFLLLTIDGTATSPTELSLY